MALWTACGEPPTGRGRSLTVAPAVATLFVADTIRFTATLRHADGTTVSVEPTWRIADTTVATVDAGGLVAAHATGATAITASLDGMVARATLVVSSDTGLVIALEPAELELVSGDSGRLQASVRDWQGQLVPVAVVWTSSDVAVAAVDTAGWVFGKVAGTARIRAAAGLLAAEATVMVTVRLPAATILAAGDISKCSLEGDEETARLLDAEEGIVLALGDNVYERGTLEEFNSCYHPTWGRHRDRTRPVPGNHEYETQGAAGYFAYFGERAGDPGRGYYSFDVGAWHIIALNSNIDMRAGSAQERWLRNDLAATTRACTLAYWHHPLFSSGPLAAAATKPLFQALYDAGADLVLTAHEHNYERFAPQTPEGQHDGARGIRQITVGTGGAGTHGFGPTPAPNSEIRYRDDYGILKLTLHADRYEWRFISVAGATFTDSGSGSCH